MTETLTPIENWTPLLNTDVLQEYLLTESGFNWHTTSTIQNDTDVQVAKKLVPRIGTYHQFHFRIKRQLDNTTTYFIGPKYYEHDRNHLSTR